MSEQPQIPNPQESDSDEIRWALETARSLWANDAREALRWLRRAAETASDAGDDMRSVQLARAAADLRSAANIQGSLPPPASAAPPPAQAAVQPSPAVPVAGAADAAGALAAGQSATATPVWSPQSAPEPNGAPAAPVGAAPGAAAPVAAAAVAAPAPAVVAAAPAPAAPALVAAAPAVAVEPAAAAEPAAARGAGQPPPLPPDFGAPPPAPPTSGPSQMLGRGAAAPAAAPVQPEPVAVASQPAAASPVQAPIQPAQVAPAVAAEPDPASMFEAEPTLVEQPPVVAVRNGASSDASLPGFVSHQALRVAFDPQTDEFGQLLVRPLIEGEQAPAGWVTALLVGLEAGNVVLASAD